jgi:hypothetical protein
MDSSSNEGRVKDALSLLRKTGKGMNLIETKIKRMRYLAKNWLTNGKR